MPTRYARDMIYLICLFSCLYIYDSTTLVHLGSFSES
jgi:hypothetical protein